MTLTIAGVARDAWTRWRRERGLLLVLAGPLLFLPLFAWLLLIDEPVAPPGVGDADRMRLLIDWMTANLHWLVLRLGAELFGSAVILSLFLSRRHRDVAELLRQTVRLFPMFLAAVVASWGLIAVGFFALIVPGLYIYGRLCLTGPALVAEPALGLAGAIARSVALTRGHGWQLFGYLALTLLAGMAVLQLIGGVADALSGAGAANPVATAIVEALAAAAVTATAVARLLMEVAIYRRLTRPRHGV